MNSPESAINASSNCEAAKLKQNQNKPTAGKKQYKPRSVTESKQFGSFTERKVNSSDEDAI